MIEFFVSVLTQIIIFIGLYFTIFWILILLNRDKSSPKLSKYPSVSILIPAYNEEKGLRRTIESCLRLSYKGKLKIYVINDASTDSTLDVANEYKSKIIIVDKKKNAGKAAALNTVIKNIDTELFAVMDADSVISKTSLKLAVRRFYREDNEKVGAVISRMRPENTKKNLLERVQLIEYMMVGLFRSLSSSIRLLHLTPGVLSVYDSKLVQKLGGFDSSNLTEDFEIALRIRKEGYLVDYCSENRVYTKTPSDFKVFLKQRIRWSRGFIQTHTKHRKAFFNPKLGLFGMFQLPLNILGPIIFFLAVFTISFNVYRKLYELMFRIINTPSLISWLELPELRTLFLTLNPTTDLLIITSIFLVLFLLWSVIRFYDYNFFKEEPLKKVYSFIIYIMVYNYIYIYVWIVALYREIKGKSYDWGTK